MTEWLRNRKTKNPFQVPSESAERVVEGRRYLEAAQRRQTQRRTLLSRISEGDYHRLTEGITRILAQNISDEEKHAQVMNLIRHVSSFGEAQSHLAEIEEQSMFPESEETIHRRQRAMEAVKRITIRA